VLLWFKLKAVVFLGLKLVVSAGRDIAQKINNQEKGSITEHTEGCRQGTRKET